MQRNVKYQTSEDYPELRGLRVYVLPINSVIVITAERATQFRSITDLMQNAGSPFNKRRLQSDKDRELDMDDAETNCAFYGIRDYTLETLLTLFQKARACNQPYKCTRELIDDYCTRLHIFEQFGYKPHTSRYGLNWVRLMGGDY